MPMYDSAILAHEKGKFNEGKLIIAKSDGLHPCYCILADPGVLYAFLEIASIPNIIYMTR